MGLLDCMFCFPNSRGLKWENKNIQAKKVYYHTRKENINRPSL